MIWVLIGSCCDADKVCLGGSSELGQFPYAYGSTVNFGDTTGNKIVLKFYETYVGSEPYDVKGKCSVPRKVDQCISKIWLKADVVDSANILSASEMYFQVGFEKEEAVGRDLKAYNLLAFGLPYMMVNMYQDSLGFEGSGMLRVNNHKTPYKEYPLVFMKYLKTTNGVQTSCYTPNGRLVSFSLLKDNSHFFYEME
jgi:hypothetical protein